MAKNGMKKYIVDLIKCNDSDFRYSFFRSLLFNTNGRGTVLSKEMSINPLLRGKILNTLCVKRLSQLSNIRFAYNETMTDRDAIQYACRFLEICESKVNRYIKLRKEYERAYMKKEYTEASVFLNSIETELGISLWSCGQRLMLKEQTLGLEGNKHELTNMCNNIDGGVIVLSVLFFYSCMAECDLSYENYQTELMQIIGESRETLIGRYLLGKLSFSDMYENKDISLILQVDSQCSLVDLYNSVEKYLPAVLHDDICNEDWLADIAMPEAINSNVFANIQMLMGASEMQVNDHLLENEAVFEIIEQYTLGNYADVVEIATEYLNKNPCDLQIAILLCKSLICGEIDYPEDFSIQYVRSVYSIYCLSDGYREAVKDLKQTIKINHGSILSLKVHALLMRKHLEIGNNKSVFVSSLLDPVIHPNLLRYFKCNSSVSQVICAKESSYCPSAIALSKAIQTGNFNDEGLQLVVKEKKDYLLANYLCKQEDYDGALSIVGRITESYSRNPYLKERLERIRLSAYAGKKDYVFAVMEIVSIFFENEFMYERLADNGYCHYPKRIKNKMLNANIDYVIYRYIADPSDYTKQISAYCNFLDSNNYSNILDFAEIIDAKLSRKYRFFFENVCNVNLLKHDVTLHTMNISAESARLQILQKLSAAFPSKKYMTEIQNLLTAEAIKENLQAINKSRIFADTNKIYSMHKDAWEEVFAKYLKLRNADAYYVDIDMAGQNKEEMEALGIRFATQGRVKQATIVLKNIVNQILEEFLFSTQYGLETHLSSRIRHGYCKGQLTTFLDDLHLLSKHKHEDGIEYIISEYWEYRIGKLDASQDVETALSLFTSKIENKTAEILTSWLHIKLKEGAIGCFDYSSFTDFCVNYYYYHDKNITNFSLFYNRIVDTFWLYTNQLLDVIRRRIELDLKEFYLSAIGDLESDLRKIESISDYVQELLSNCILAKAKVVPAMKQFSDAFTLNNNSYNDFSMDELVASCKKVVERAHSNSEAVNWHINADESLLFSGKFFVSFVDILSILLNNAIEHSGFEHYGDLSIDIFINKVEDCTVEEIALIPDVSCYGKILCMEVRNNLADCIDTNMLEKNMKELIASLTPNQFETTLIQSEGGSGLYKLYNIVTYNLESLCTLICDVSEDSISIRYNFIADKFLAKEEDDEGITN